MNGKLKTAPWLRFRRLCVWLALGALIAGCAAPQLSPGPTPTQPSPARTASLATRATAALPAGFSLTGGMASARVFHTATLLPSGEVLVAGGDDGSKALSSAELYDPATATFRPTGSMSTVRESHVAVILNDGTVLVAGGWTGKERLLATAVTSYLTASADTFDPVTGSFSAAHDLPMELADAGAAPLPDNRVLIAGGWNRFMQFRSGVTYFPRIRSFAGTGSMETDRFEPTATSLADGRVLIVGGLGPLGLILSREEATPIATAEVYDADTGLFARAGKLHLARVGHSATLLPDGRVLIAGGRGADGRALDSAEVFDPANGSFRQVGSMLEARRGHTATLLPDGKVLIVDGYGPCSTACGPLASAELFDPATGSFRAAAKPVLARAYHTATLLADGSVLIVGGQGEMGPLPSAERYRP